MPPSALFTQGTHRPKRHAAIRSLPSVEPNPPPFASPFCPPDGGRTARAHGFGKPRAASTRAFARLFTTTSTAASLQRSPLPLQAASAFNAFAPTRFGLFGGGSRSRQRRREANAPLPAAPALIWKGAFPSARPAAAPTCRRLFRTFAFPRGRLRLQPTPPRPAFAHTISASTTTAQRWRQRHGGAVQPPRQATLLRPTNHHGEPTAKPCPLHARLGAAHRLNKHTPAGWPTHHGALTPPAPRPTNLSTILQHASGDNSAFANPHPENTFKQKRGTRCHHAAPQQPAGTNGHWSITPEAL